MAHTDLHCSMCACLTCCVGTEVGTTQPLSQVELLVFFKKSAVQGIIMYTCSLYLLLWST